MELTPWYKVVFPREDLREGRPLDASEFAVHLDQIRDRRAPEVYQKPEEFLDRTYLTRELTAMAGEVLRRLSGIKTETSAVYNMSTQFGGGKTHALTLLYHLARSGPAANSWNGVQKILASAGLASVPLAATAVFVGTEFDSLTGRGGADGTPKRRTPWGEIAYQLGGEAALAVVARHEEEFIEPKGDVIRAFLPKDRPCLILMDEIINYASTYRRYGYHNALYNFIQALSETARGQDNVVLVVSIPASELEYTSEDHVDEQRFKKMLDRVGKAVLMSAEAETAEIIRRRLFEWGGLPAPARKVAAEYADWVADHRQQLPGWFPFDSAREAFEATYPFHPVTISVFERKWQALPRFHRTRGILRLLALWVSRAYQEGFRGAQRDPLIGLGTAPLDDPQFRAAAFEQLGQEKLEVAVASDICGRKDAHAVRLDEEAVDAIKRARLHRKVAATIFFESNGGQTQTYATLPEIRLAVGEPGLDIGNVETVLEALASSCYYLRANANRYSFTHKPGLNRLLADRRAMIKSEVVRERARAEIQKVFGHRPPVTPLFFPEQSGQIPDHAALTLVVLAPDHALEQREATLALVERLTREHGASARTFKSALIWAVADKEAELRDKARDMLAWEGIRDEAPQLGLDEEQGKQLAENLRKAEGDVREAVWRAYNKVVLLGKDNTLRVVDLGLVHSSAGESLVALIISRLRQDGDVEDAISPSFIVRNWPPAFVEWSTRAVRDAFFASPQFPRLLNGDALKETIAKGVTNGFLGYVGKTAAGDYQPFHLSEPLSALEVELADDMFIITKETAEAYKKRKMGVPVPASLQLSPQQATLRPGGTQAFSARVLDQHGQEMPTERAQWSAAGGQISASGVYTAGGVEGQFTITATCGGIAQSALVTIAAGAAPPPPPPPSRTTRLSWTGEVPAQKWMNFYTRVLTRFVQRGGLRITLTIDVNDPAGLPQQAVDDTIVALRELGLNEDVSTGQGPTAV